MARVVASGAPEFWGESRGLTVPAEIAWIDPSGCLSHVLVLWLAAGGPQNLVFFTRSDTTFSSLSVSVFILSIIFDLTALHCIELT